ncbi:aspartate aminotransferase family protein [Brevibacillus sp. SYSU BS000544]|uniref:aspartate aminotransferase family protein n=1 Tax=Brevibacillus sp. SYSU BS000544 TaxID=3416443 RepID=UPI003CE52599
MSTYKRLPIAIAKGEGNYLYDAEGKSYLDLFTGLAVNILGHSHPEVMKALREQGEKFLHISNYFLNPPAIQLAKRLIDHTIPGKVFFGNSGAEATEAAIKLIHKWTLAQGNEKSGIVVLKNSFHGRTLGALRLTRQAHVYQDFPQPTFPVYEIEAGSIEALRTLCQTEKPAAILMEPVLGSGGVIPLSDEYLQQVEAVAKEHGILFCIDEIQTGIGRTGKLFCYQHAGITPDVILFAKGVGGGLPLGGIIVGSKLTHLFQPGDHGTTFAPSPLSAALGNAVLDVLEQDLFLFEANAVAKYLWDQLTELSAQYPSLFSALRGRGMMLGLPTNLAAEEVSAIQQHLLRKGILVDVTQRTIIRLLPPLTLTKDQVDLLVGQLTEAIEQVVIKKGAV